MLFPVFLAEQVLSRGNFVIFPPANEINECKFPYAQVWKYLHFNDVKIKTKMQNFPRNIDIYPNLCLTIKIPNLIYRRSNYPIFGDICWYACSANETWQIEVILWWRNEWVKEREEWLHCSFSGKHLNKGIITRTTEHNCISHFACRRCRLDRAAVTIIPFFPFIQTPLFHHLILISIHYVHRSSLLTFLREYFYRIMIPTFV